MPPAVDKQAAYYLKYYKKLEIGIMNIIVKEHVQYDLLDSLLLIPNENGVLETNHAIGLEDTAAFIWKCITENKDYNSIIKRLLEEYEVKVEELEKDVSALLDKLENANLIYIEKS